MNSAIASIRLIGGWLPFVVDLAAIVLTLLAVTGLLVPARSRLAGSSGSSRAPRLRRSRRFRGILVIAGTVVGAALGLFLCWLLSDQLNLFDVSLTPISRTWVTGAFAVVGVAVSAFIGMRGAGREPHVDVSRRLVRSVAVAAAVTALLAGTLGVNADFGQYTTIGSLSDASIAPPVPATVLAQQQAAAPGYASPASSTTTARPLWKDAVAIGMPSHGLVGTVTIPSTVSQFPARGAYVYLPPAALVPHPVALPVLIMLSGQPGSPSNVISSGQIATIFDDFAAAHNGLAPIVVAPDQLGAPSRNPMCVDGSLGASASYLTVDVPNWIRSHFTVQTSPGAWAIGGFSQGGTCSIQLGAAHPELFSAIVDISGQIAPKNGGKTQTVSLGFGGDIAAYRAALPTTVLARNAPYRKMVAVFGVGQLDSRYGPVAAQMTAAAASAGIHATEAISPGTGHDWHTVQWVLRNSLGTVYHQLGLEAAS
ncbi:MAG: alpha/beta hydrolase-fold protein [Actinomycetota bacterium]|nr:alpha/beta hydrolase-fold protein [Actinomycetota bacterium]